MNHSRELAVAHEAAREAARVIMDHYASFSAIADAAASITTQADRDAQESILRKIADSFPDDAYRAEEKTPKLAELKPAGPRMWIIDPIDGTRGFARKNGEFSVMIALAEDGEVTVGVVLEPATGRTVFAAKGSGCFQQSGSGISERVHVTQTADLSAATLIQSHSNPQRGPSRATSRLLTPRVIETYSAGIKMARVADGTADIYLCDYDALNDWDLAAGHILIEEAGGHVTDLVGQPIRYGGKSPKHQGGLLATNGCSHEAALHRWSSRT